MFHAKTNLQSAFSMRRIFLAIAIPLIYLSPLTADAQRVFVQIQDIPGESRAEGFKDAIEALSWQWGVSNTPAMRDGRQITTRANFNKLSFVHTIDQASPLLMQHCASGKHIENVRLTLPVPGSKLNYLVIDLKDVIVSEVAISGDLSASNRPTELVSLSYSEIKMTYTPQRTDGSAGRAVLSQWNLLKNGP